MSWISESKKIIRSGSVFFVSSIVVSVLAYGFHLFAARILEVADYGSLQTLISLQNIALVPITILIVLLTRTMAEHKQDNAEEKSLVLRMELRKLFLFPGIVILPILFLITPFLQSFFHIDSTVAFILLWISLYLTIFQGIDGSLLNGWHKFFESNVSTVTNGVSKFVLGLSLMALGLGIVGGFLGITIGFALGVLINMYFVSSKFSRAKSIGKNNTKVLPMDKKGMIKVFKYSYPVIMGIIAIAIFSNVDTLIAKHHFSAVDAGRYGGLFVLSKIIFFAVSSLSAIVVPLLTAEKDIKKKNRYFSLIMVANLLIAGVSVLVFYLFPEIVIGLLFGHEYIDIAPYLAKFGLLALFLSTLNIFVQYFISLKYEGVLIAITIISLGEIVFLWFFGTNFIQFFVIILISLGVANAISCGYFWKRLISV